MPNIDPLVQKLDPSIRDHVADMMRDAAEKYGCKIHVNQTQRTAEQAQTFHLLHMYLYNYFAHLKPKYPVEGGKTIDWDHMQDPDVEWDLIDDLKDEFLLTASGQPALLKDNGPAGNSWVVEPDKIVSTRAMARYLEKHHVSSMAAPGLDGCGEPCLCGGHASKHITGKACDLGGLPELGAKIVEKEPGQHKSPVDAVDEFLKEYHLWRPLAHLKGKAQELWHVELIPPHRKKLPPHPRVQHRHLKSPPSC